MKFADKQAALETADVLVIDDDPGDIVLTRQVLKHGGTFGQILSASSADEALALFRGYLRQPDGHAWTRLPAVVLLDIWMPVKTGHDFLEEFAELRDNELLGGVVVAMLSSSSADHDRMKSSRFSFVIDYLVKPLGVADVDRFLSGIATRRGVRHQS